MAHQGAFCTTHVNRLETHEPLPDRAPDGGGRLSDRIQRRWNSRDRRSRWLRNGVSVLEALPSISWRVARPFQTARRTTSHCNSGTCRGSASTWRRRQLWVECLLARPAVRDTAPPPIQGDEKCSCNRPPRPMRGVSRTCVKSDQKVYSGVGSSAHLQPSLRM